MILLFALLAAGWTQGAAAVAPPKCSDAGRASAETGWLPGHQVLSVSVPAPTSANGPPPTWTRWCGPEVVLLRLDGTSFRIAGGRCSMGAVLFGFQVGLVGATPDAPAKSFRLYVSDPRHSAGAFRPSEASIQVGGQSFAMPQQIATGTVTIRQSLHAGRFALRLRDATRVTGSWT